MNIIAFWISAGIGCVAGYFLSFQMLVLATAIFPLVLLYMILSEGMNFSKSAATMLVLLGIAWATNNIAVHWLLIVPVLNTRINFPVFR